MGKHNARPRPGRMIPVLGTSCGLLAAAAFTGGIRPAIALPEAGDTAVTVASGAAESASDTVSPLGGPLQMPEIGVVAPDFDEQYAALLSAARSTPEPTPLPPAWEPTQPTQPTQPAPTSPPAPVAPNSSDDVSPAPSPPVTPDAEEPPAEEPPAETPPAEEPPAEEPPAETPPAEEPPAEEPPAEAPPGEEPPAEEPPAEEPPPEEPTEEPTEEPLGDVELAPGESFDVLDASGQVAYSIVVDGVVPDVVCTAEDNLPAENGHLVGLRLRVTPGPASAEGPPPPAISASDFDVVGAEAEAATASAAACLRKTEDFPSTPLTPGQEAAGTIVLDVADLTGTISFRSAAPAVSLLWRF